MSHCGRYVSGLGTAVLGLCAAGWLALVPTAFGYRGAGLHQATLADRATGAGLAVAAVITLCCWAGAWRRGLRADGVLTGHSRRQARRDARAQAEARTAALAGTQPDPERVLNDLRSLLTTLVPGPRPAEPEPRPSQPQSPGGVAALESMLAGTEVLTTGCGEEEAW